jgi:hypothetical protein
LVFVALRAVAFAVAPADLTPLPAGLSGCFDAVPDLEAPGLADDEVDLADDDEDGLLDLPGMAVDSCH